MVTTMAVLHPPAHLAPLSPAGHPKARAETLVFAQGVKSPKVKIRRFPHRAKVKIGNGVV